MPSEPIDAAAPHLLERGRGGAGPVDEQVRARAVEQLGVLGTPREQRFDRLTRLARQLLGVPLAYLSVVDGDMLWMKTIDGYDGDVLPREVTFCDVTLDIERPLVVPDALADPRTAGLASVVGAPHLRAYAGHPVTDGNGIVVGTFCVADTVPREFRADQLAVLTELAEWARQELVQAVDNNRAREVQQRLLPRRLPEVAGYEVAALCRPAQTVGGDYYDLAAAGDGTVELVLADVMGKGTGAAIVTATVRAVLRGTRRIAARLGAGADGAGGSGGTGGAGGPAGRVATVMREASHVLQRDLDATATFVTAFVAELDPAAHRLAWVDAGHGLALVTGADGGVRWLDSSDTPIGIDPDQDWTARTLELAPGDQLVVFSDGLLDLMGGTILVLEDIARLCSEAAGPAALVAEVDELCSRGVLTDDVTVVAVRRVPVSG